MFLIIMLRTFGFNDYAGIIRQGLILTCVSAKSKIKVINTQVQTKLLMLAACMSMFCAITIIS